MKEASDKQANLTSTFLDGNSRRSEQGMEKEVKFNLFGTIYVATLN